MNKDVCLIPCWQRPDFLHLNLERIRAAEHSKELKYMFKLDSGYSRDCLEVIKKFSDEGYDVTTIVQERMGYIRGKQSYNVLTGYSFAVEKAARLVFMVEEDIMIANDFFSWHYAVHEKEADILFCSIATANNNRKVPVTTSLSDYYLTHGDYQSLGVCFNKNVLLNEILPLACHEYYSNPSSFVQKHFPNSAIGNAFAEQDGLIRRVQEHQKKFIAFPHVARAYHSGFIGYNRQKGFNMALNQKIEYIRRIIFSDEEMKRVNKNPAFYEDSKPVNLTNPPLDYELTFNQPQINFQ